MRRIVFLSRVLRILLIGGVLVACGSRPPSATDGLASRPSLAGRSAPHRVGPPIGGSSPRPATVTPVPSEPRVPPSTSFAVTTYHNRPLPLHPDPDRPTLPAAWLIMEDQIIQAAFLSAGTYDVFPAPDALPVVRLPVGSRPVIVIGEGPINRISVTGGPPPTRFALEPEPDTPTSFRLEPVVARDAYSLHALVWFGSEPSSDASYGWRIEPFTP